MKKLQTAIIRLAQADMVFFLLPPLMALLIAGTITQRWLGLYEAHHMFFASFFFWAGPVPLPGGYTLLGLLSLSLTLKFLFKSDWSWPKAGIILIHLGALILLVGGLLTALYAKERYMIIAEGSESPYAYDYLQRELSIYSEDDLKFAIPFDNFDAPPRLNTLPFELKILDSCTNCEILKREEVPYEYDDKPLRSLAQFMALKDKPLEKDPEGNIAGLMFEINGIDDDQDGVYLAIEGMPAPVTLITGERHYKIILGKAQTRLPFTIALTNFEKDSYPGTDKARAYRSDIIVKDGALEWPARVEMNKPLRYKGYTLFQSSFEESAQGQFSIFSVVENKGRLAPYIGTTILALGLLLHILLIMRRRDAEAAS